MNISDLLSPAQVIADLRARDKRQVIDVLARHAALALNLEVQAIDRALLAREALGSTGMGKGTALPHARLPEIRKPFALFARLQGAVEFDAIDGRPVDLVCLVLLPTTPQGEQLNALACVARRFRDHDVLTRLRKADGPEPLYRALVDNPALQPE